MISSDWRWRLLAGTHLSHNPLDQVGIGDDDPQQNVGRSIRYTQPLLPLLQRIERQPEASGERGLG